MRFVSHRRYYFILILNNFLSIFILVGKQNKCLWFYISNWFVWKHNQTWAALFMIYTCLPLPLVAAIQIHSRSIKINFILSVIDKNFMCASIPFHLSSVYWSTQRPIPTTFIKRNIIQNKCRNVLGGCWELATRSM